MTAYEIDGSYMIKEWASVTLNANDVDHAEDLAKEYFLETYPEAEDFEIDAIREVIVN